MSSPFSRFLYNKTFDLRFESRQPLQDLLRMTEPIELLLFEGPEKKLRSVKLVEWRHLLNVGALKANLELPRFNGGPAVGVLSLELNWLPKSSLQLIPERNLNEHFAQEKKY